MLWKFKLYVAAALLCESFITVSLDEWMFCSTVDGSTEYKVNCGATVQSVGVRGSVAEILVKRRGITEKVNCSRAWSRRLSINNAMILYGAYDIP